MRIDALRYEGRGLNGAGPRRVAAAEGSVSSDCDDDPAEQSDRSDRAEPGRESRLWEQWSYENCTEQKKLDREPDFAMSFLRWTGFRGGHDGSTAKRLRHKAQVASTLGITR